MGQKIMFIRKPFFKHHSQKTMLFQSINAFETGGKLIWKSGYLSLDVRGKSLSTTVSLPKKSLYKINKILDKNIKRQSK